MKPEIDLSKCVSEDGYYVIPVEWSVASTVRIKADNLQDAIHIVNHNIDDLPLCTDPEYIEDSYHVATESLEISSGSKTYTNLRHIGNITLENGQTFHK